MLLFCIESVQSFDDCGHEARAICQTGNTTAASMAQATHRRIVATIPLEAAASRSDKFDAHHLGRLPELPPTTSLQSQSSAMRTVIGLRTTKAGAPGGADQLRAKRSEQPPQLSTPRQASASPLGSCVRPAWMSAATLREMRVIGLLDLTIGTLAPKDKPFAALRLNSGCSTGRRPVCLPVRRRPGDPLHWSLGRAR